MYQPELLISDIISLLIFGISPGKFVSTKFDGFIYSLSCNNVNVYCFKSNIVTDAVSFDASDIGIVFCVGLINYISYDLLRWFNKTLRD